MQMTIYPTTGKPYTETGKRVVIDLLNGKATVEKTGLPPGGTGDIGYYQIIYDLNTIGPIKQITVEPETKTKASRKRKR
jgi:hypothetical protein